MFDETATNIESLAPDSGLRDEAPESSNTCPHGHEWVVYSNAGAEFWLRLQCVECGTLGTIDDPSTEEWLESFYAPSNPYRWLDGARVTHRGVASPRVIRDDVGPPCRCPLHPGLAATSGYARIPGGIATPDGVLTDAERSELLEISDLVGGSDLCSHLLPHFIRSFEADTGSEHSVATHEIVGRIERFDTKGLNCSPSVVAKLLKDYANSDPIP